MLKLYPLLILATSLFWGCVIGFFDGDIESKCGEEKYTAANQICENGVLMKMCGDEYYNSKMQFCFNNIIFKKCGDKNYDPSNQKCDNHVVLDKCDNDYYNSAMQFCLNEMLYNKCNCANYCIIYDIEKYRCENDVLFAKCGNEDFDPSLEYCANGTVKEKEYFTDILDGKIYKYVTIGTQIWMAENLRHETSNSKCYSNNPENCEIFGMLYDWNTAKTICPSGWHLPSDEEWNILRDFAGNEAGTKLRANSSLWEVGRGTDDFGFTALPGGRYSFFENDLWQLLGNQASFWSATSSTTAGFANFRYLEYNERTLSHASIMLNHNMVNVRCIKD